jgi:hypothetical protein
MPEEYLDVSDIGSLPEEVWESRFTLDWTVEAGRDGSRLIEGYIQSMYGRSVEPIRLLVQACARADEEREPATPQLR